MKTTMDWRVRNYHLADTTSCNLAIALRQELCDSLATLTDEPVLLSLSEWRRYSIVNPFGRLTKGAFLMMQVTAWANIVRSFQKVH